MSIFTNVTISQETSPVRGLLHILNVHFNRCAIGLKYCWWAITKLIKEPCTFPLGPFLCPSHSSATVGFPYLEN